MATKAREDEEETAPSDKFDPLKEAHDFLAVNGIAVGGLSIGKGELDTNEVRYSIFIVSMHKVSL